MKKDTQCLKCVMQNLCEKKSERTAFALKSCTMQDLRKTAKDKGLTMACIIDMLVADYICFL